MSIARMWRGVLCVALLLAAGSSAGKPTSGQNQANERNAAQNAANTVADAIRKVRPDKDKGCEDRKDNRGSDLCAQWKAADANQRAATYTLIAIILSALGTGLVAFSFIETVRTNRRELRAYIFPERIMLFDGTQEGMREDLMNVPYVELVLKNHGKTPARNVRHAGAVVMELGSSRNDPPRHCDLRKIHGQTLPPDATHIHYIALSGTPIEDRDGRCCITPEIVKKINEGEWGIMLYGTVIYEDMFGKERATDYRFFQTNLWPPKGGTMSMRYAGRGNSDT